MAPYYCQIAGCGAMLLGFDYIAVELDTGERAAVCRPCWRKISKKENEQHHFLVRRSSKNG